MILRVKFSKSRCEARESVVKMVKFQLKKSFFYRIHMFLKGFNPATDAKMNSLYID